VLRVQELLREAQRRLRVGHLDRTDPDHPRGRGGLPVGAVPRRPERGSGMTSVPIERHRTRVQRGPGRHGVLFVLVAILLLVRAPMAVIMMNAFKSPSDYAGNGPLSLPHSLYLHGIIDFWNRVDFGRKLLNSFLVSAVVAVGGVLLSILNAYALGIGRVRGRL